MREFRRTPEGNWQRLEPDGVWTTLHVVRADPSKHQSRHPSPNRAPTRTNEWLWL